MGELRTVMELKTRDEDAFIFSKQKRRHLVFVPWKNVRVVWDEQNTDEVENAEKTFRKFIDEGWLSFSITPDGKNVQIFKFNPSLKNIVLIPPEGGG